MVRIKRGWCMLVAGRIGFRGLGGVRGPITVWR